MQYEGVDLPIAPSDKGDAKGRLHAVRDPGIYEENGNAYLLYSVAGEYGIAIAEIDGPRHKWRGHERRAQPDHYYS